MKMLRFSIALTFIFAFICSARADTTYFVTVNTASVAGTTGSLDLNFNPGPLASQGATLTISSFSSDATLGSGGTMIGSVAGSLPSGLTFNNGPGLNDYFQVVTFGSKLSFSITLSGPALLSPDGVSTSGSAFAFSLFSDAAGTKPALTSDTVSGFGLIANVNLDGTVTITNNLPSGVLALVPTVSVTSPQTITTGQTLSVMISLSGAKGSPLPTGSVTLTGGGYTSPATPLSNGAGTIVIPAGSLSPGTDMLTAAYSGDSNYASATGASTVVVTVPNLTISSIPVTIAPGATIGNTATVTVTPTGGFTGTVALTAMLTGSPNGAKDLPTFSFMPSSTVVITSATPETATLIISTTASGSSAAMHRPATPHFGFYVTGGTAFASLLLLGLPARRRRRAWSVLGMCGFLIAASSGLSSCGNSPPRNPGTTPGSYTVQLTATSNVLTSTTTFTLTVQ